jgi:hypothetical protein
MMCHTSGDSFGAALLVALHPLETVIAALMIPLVLRAELGADLSKR